MAIEREREREGRKRGKGGAPTRCQRREVEGLSLPRSTKENRNQLVAS